MKFEEDHPAGCLLVDLFPCPEPKVSTEEITHPAVIKV